MPEIKKCPKMKYILIINGESGDGDTAVICETPQERRLATTKALLDGEPSKSDEEYLNSVLNELQDNMYIDFEGDPGLRWIDAADVQSRSISMETAQKLADAMDMATFQIGAKGSGECANCKSILDGNKGHSENCYVGNALSRFNAEKGGQG